ncbi:MAG: proteasome subunit alpha [Chthoniobacteraceae bacterium]
MIDEPYRWVEAIANRREYIEHQLAPGSPIVALSYADGIVLLTLSRERQKIFEIYDRIAMGGIGHPGDIERLRLAAIELCSTEGFARSAHDVSLRRLANFSLSPALKAAFEQVYGAPYLARLIFAELGRGDVPNLFLRLDYDGSIHTNGGSFGRSFEEFGVIAGTKSAAERMERLLREHDATKASLSRAVRIAAEAWSLGHMASPDDAAEELPKRAVLKKHLDEQLAHAAVECAVLERSSTLPITWRALPEAETRAMLDAE